LGKSKTAKRKKKKKKKNAQGINIGKNSNITWLWVASHTAGLTMFQNCTMLASTFQNIIEGILEKMFFRSNNFD